MDAWTPADMLEAGKLLMQFAQFVGTIFIVAFMLFMKKDLDGRASQIIDLVRAVVGAPPDKRTKDEPVEVERRSKNK